ncbi:nitrilase-related carbon-nitrogen hydrolase [Actinoplanes sp. NEAU-A12]|uniref:Nitrilase-related carbon-nitrogen hydrolase n=1 Tax=Actinoplanes sandaracinus TaxID=3045177 RepID=A0ABT6WKM0_9ACTN|nr:nitrilase-related carbon-nitrogen hydrolase [Actinoplanes sandaracinus]MDI6100269.1 nitrilase-related carbon-nitrogen hydrolase [Actinoplanes sandaracinus]
MTMELIRSAAYDSPARVEEPARPPLRVGLVQHRWREDAAELREVLFDGIARAAGAGARAVFLPELTLSRYPAFEAPAGRPAEAAEDIETGPTVAFAAEAAKRHGILVHASLYERTDLGDGLGYNTAVLVDPAGAVIAKTRKTHIPVTEGYVEDKYFRPGPADGAYPVHEALEARFGLPTCWDQWFPEVARLYALGGADILVYPTAIGSEPDHPDFDTQPLWQQVIIGNAIANGLFMVVPNRTGDEGLISFYGSSFIADPYGRVLAQAPRDAEAVLVADLDLDQRGDWLTLFPFLRTRRPDTYGGLA